MTDQLEDSVFGQFVYHHGAYEALSELKSHINTTEGYAYVERGDKRITLDETLNRLDVWVRSEVAAEGVSSGLEINISYQQFQSDSGYQKYQKFLEAMKLVYEATNPAYAYVTRQSDIEAMDMYLKQPTSNDALSENRIIAPTWVMLFTPPMVEEYGREWLLDLPADRMDKLFDGGLLIVSTERLVSDPEDGSGYDDDMAQMDEAFGLDPTETGHDLIL